MKTRTVSQILKDLRTRVREKGVMNPGQQPSGGAGSSRIGSTDCTLRKATPMTQSNDSVIQWLLDGDPAIRWQVLRDLVGAAQSTVERERRRIARDGWGARLLARQDREGTWAGGLYTPKWISTTYTMLLLRDFGLPPMDGHARRACAPLLDEGLQRDGGINYGSKGQSETCITGMVLPFFLISSMTTIGSTRSPTTCSRSRCRTGAGTASGPAARPMRHFTPPSARSRGCGCTKCTGGGKFAQCAPLSNAAESSCWCIGFFVPIAPARSSSPSSCASLFRRAGTTTSCARLIISRPSMRLETSASQRR